ncbi:hypothetical protein [Haladaptatus cibarius]|uniref:hypothetical protein n=1 Tax=Haladaptatus cibarius TaxID=453847 RepID=UPI000ACF07A9|nr:hypothetical protein [Haladaptatus cibarius]
MSSRPFFTFSPDELDTAQILNEALPLAKLIGAVGVAALIPMLLQFFLIEVFGLVPVFGLLFTLATQFILAVGTGIVLIYVIVRANQLADE